MLVPLPLPMHEFLFLQVLLIRNNLFSSPEYKAFDVIPEDFIESLESVNDPSSRILDMILSPLNNLRLHFRTCFIKSLLNFFPALFLRRLQKHRYCEISQDLMRFY